MSFGVPDLGDPALAHHRDTVRYCKRFGLIVRDIYRRDAGLRCSRLQLDAHLLAQLRVEIGKRFVEQKQPWFAGKGTRKRQPLLLTT